MRRAHPLLASILLLPLLASAADAPAPAPWDVEAAHGPGRDVRFTVSKGTWLGLDVSPDGSTLLFDLLGDVWTLPMTGGPARALTTGVAWDTDAHWAPDGTRIAFSSDRGGNEELWVMGADGSNPTPLTAAKVDRYTDPVWAPEAGWLVGRRRSVDTRSIGVQELWLLHEQGGDGIRLTKKEEDPHAGEAAFSPDGRYLWFSTRAGRFEYDQNIHQGLWQIARYDRVLGERVTLTDLAGGAVRPTPSPDGKTLAFLTRERERTVLMLMDLASGRVRPLTDQLDGDQMEGFELRGAYPRMDWTPDGKSLVTWAQGGFWKVDAATGARTEIPFTADVRTRVTDTVRAARRVAEGPVHARVLRWPTVLADGSTVVAGVGRIWRVSADGATSTALTPEGVTAYFPSVSPDGRSFAWVSWDDQTGGQVWVQPLSDRARPRQVTVTPGQYQAPAWSPDGKELAFLRGSGAPARGKDLGSEAFHELLIAPVTGGDGKRVRSVPFRGPNAPRPQFSPDGQRLWWIEDEPQEGRKPELTVLVSSARDGTDKQIHVRFEGAQEVRISPDFRHLLYRQAFEAWLAPLPALGRATVAEADLPRRRLTDRAGDQVGWVDADRVSWIHGDRLSVLPVTGVLVKDAKEVPTANDRTLKVEVPRLVGQGLVAFTNARIVPVEGAPIERGTLVVDGRRIVAVGADVKPPAGATVYDATGKTILPGLIDVHAHLHFSSGDVFPEQEWRHLVNLAYGVTTVFDPSAYTDLVFGQGELVEAGRMAGPRVLSTGYILYGALDRLAAKVESYEDAERHVGRLAEVGAWGVKSYQQSHRSARQQIVEACRKLGLLDVPEGGGDLMMNLGMLLDGHSSIEHAIPVAPLYEDVIQLWAATRTVYTPTLLVAYGGPSGELEPFAAEKVWQDSRLARFTPPEVLTSRAYRLAPVITDPREWHHHEVARSAARLREAGVLVALGGHGQLQGLGPHWEMELLAVSGAMDNARAIEAATLSGARHLGLDQDLGSLVPGKVADLFVVDGNPLQDLEQAREVRWVMKDGVLYDAPSMDRLSPSPARREPMIWEAARTGR